jgi:hypothetical protein
MASQEEDEFANEPPACLLVEQPTDYFAGWEALVA